MGQEEVMHWKILPRTNRVQGPYCKLQTEFFPVDLWPARRKKKRGFFSLLTV